MGSGGRGAWLPGARPVDAIVLLLATTTTTCVGGARPALPTEDVAIAAPSASTAAAREPDAAADRDRAPGSADFAAHDFASALGDCRRARCLLHPAATYDATHHEWLVLLNVSTGPLTRSFWLARAWAESAKTILEGSVIQERVPEIEKAIAPAIALPPVPNLVARGAWAESRVARHVPRVVLRAPLEGAEVSIDGADLARREHVISLRRPGSDAPTVLGRRPAAVGSCDDNDWCKAHEGGCRPEELAAEDRLCVLPVSIRYVGLAPSGDSIALLLAEESRSERETREHYWIGRLPPPH